MSTPPEPKSVPPVAPDEAVDDDMFVDDEGDAPLDWPDEPEQPVSIDHAFVDDDGASDLELAERPADGTADQVSDGGGTTFDELVSDEPDEALQLPWRCRGTLNGEPVEVWLDPTRATSALVGDTAHEGGRLVLQGLSLDVVLEHIEGEPEHVVLGRDVLKGRVLISV